MQLQKVIAINVEKPLNQLRAAPVSLGNGRRGILLAYGQDYDVDPWEEMFFFPKHALKLLLFDEKGEVLWRKDLGPAVVPGLWFCPVLPFGLDGDGLDEIWFVNNVNLEHPLSLTGRRLERLDALSGERTGQWAWPSPELQPLSHTYRSFLACGYVRGKPVLVTAQGTYGSMLLQGFSDGMELRWEHRITKGAPGANGCHITPISDLDGDGVQEIMWGERCIELDQGRELFCADRDEWKGHSDIVQPFWDVKNKDWRIFTCREGWPKEPPRVAAFDDKGERVWQDVDEGHMDTGGVARIGEDREHLAFAIRISKKDWGPSGRSRFDTEEFVYNARTGEPVQLPFSIYGLLPFDPNGDGYHEFAPLVPEREGAVLDREGKAIASVGGVAAMASKFLDLPGEQLLTYTSDGVVSVWADSDAKDSPEAQDRYAHPLYGVNQKLSAVGYNLALISGL